MKLYALHFIAALLLVFAPPASVFADGQKGAAEALPAPPTAELRPLTVAESEVMAREVGSLSEAIPDAIQVARKTALIPKLLVLGQEGKLHDYLAGIVNRLALPGDSTRYTIKISADPFPNAAIYVGRSEMIINIGLLRFVKNEDELAAVIAHEMTHANPKIYPAVADSKEVDTIISGVPEAKNLEASQREELRADLGALKRLIKAGYNPWSQYDFERRFLELDNSVNNSWIANKLFKSSFEFLSTHPHASIRMAATKAYIAVKGREMDLSTLTQGKRGFPTEIQIVRARARVYTEPPNLLFLSNAPKYALIAELLYELGSLAYEKIQEEREKEPPSSRSAGLNTIDKVFAGAMGTFASGAGIGAAVITYMKVQGAAGTSTARSIRKAEQAFNEEARNPRFARERLSKGDLDPLLRILKANQKRLEALGALYWGNAGEPLEDRSNSQWLKRFPSTMRAVADAEYQELSLLRQVAEALPRLSAEARSVANSQVNNILDVFPAQFLQDRPLRKAVKEVLKVSSKSSSDAPPLVSARIELVERAQTIDAQKNPQEALELVEQLQKNDLVATADPFFEENYRPLLKWAYKKGNSPAALEQLERVQRGHSEARGVDISGENAQKLDKALASALLREKLNDQPGQIAAAAHSFGVRRPWIEMIPALALRHWLDKGNHAAVRDFFTHGFASLEELDGFVQAELVTRNVPIKHLARELNAAVLAHPEWIKSRADFDLLLKRDYYWPASGDVGLNKKLAEKIAASKWKEFTPLGSGKVWEYDPTTSEKLQIQMGNRLDELGLTPSDPADKIKLWEEMSSRGVTTVTDQMFKDVYGQVSKDQRTALDQRALDGQHVWEPAAKAEIANARLEVNRDFVALKKPGAFNESYRLGQLNALLADIKKSMPQRGPDYSKMLERVSTEIKSSESESRIIAEAKRVASGEKVEDAGLRTLSGLLDQAKKWSKDDQWSLIQFLRGDIEANPFIEEALHAIGPERVRRVFSLTEVATRTALLDSFLDSPTGLLPKVKAGSGRSAQIIDYLLADSTPEGQAIGNEVLEAFLHSLSATGNGPMRSYVLSYLLATPKSASTQGETLKNVLEVFGPTGIKIGQFLAASGLLPPEETAMMRKLQEKANIPMRDEIYRDLRKSLGSRLDDYQIGDLLGAASIKYAVKAKNIRTGETVVLKVLRPEAVAHTSSEFKQLEAMADFLYQKHGAKYGVLRSIVRASREAVQRELKMDSEVANSKIAREALYPTRTQDGVTVRVPKEDLLSDRVMVSEFAPGKSFFELSPEAQTKAAEHILRTEADNLFATDKAVIHFDPDRHAGNYRIHEGAAQPGDAQLGIAPIDFGQLLTISSFERAQILDLFALSQIFKETGPTRWGIAQAAKIMNLKPSEVPKLAQALKAYFPSKDLKDVSAYFSMLSAFEDAGHAPKIAYFDYVRAIIQLKQYEGKAPDGSQIAEGAAPSERLEQEVRARADGLLKDMKLTPAEKLGVGVARARRGLSFVPGESGGCNLSRVLKMLRGRSD